MAIILTEAEINDLKKSKIKIINEIKALKEKLSKLEDN